MRTFEEVLKELMCDPEFKSEYEALEPEYQLIRAMLDARNKLNLTQKQLSELTGIHRTDISKIENGNANPSLKLLKTLAEGMGMSLKIEFVPKIEI